MLFLEKILYKFYKIMIKSVINFEHPLSKLWTGTNLDQLKLKFNKHYKKYPGTLKNNS